MDNYLGEIRLFAGTFAPLNWSFCDGSLLSIAENDTLFALIGTTYGGDGVNTFALPDLRGRVPIGQGTGPGLTNRPLGESEGTETVTLVASQMPPHSHTVFATQSTAEFQSPEANMPAQLPTGTVFYAPQQTPPVNPIALDPDVISNSGGGQPHSNLMASVGMSYIIALQGIFPSQG
jgi:microcystin-dependent protein